MVSIWLMIPAVMIGMVLGGMIMFVVMQRPTNDELKRKWWEDV